MMNVGAPLFPVRFFTVRTMSSSFFILRSSFFILHYTFFVLHSILIYVGYDSFPSSDGLGAELFHVLAVYGVGAGHEVGGCPPDEDPGGGRGGEDGEACPFDQFAEVVGRGDVAVEAAGGQVVARVAGAAEVADDVVGVQVDAHAGEEEQQSADGAGFEQVAPACVGRYGGVPEEAAGLHHAVEQVEHDAHQQDGDGHAATAFQQQGEDEGALQVVELEQQEEQVGGHGEPGAAAGPEDEHQDENGGFHQQPAQAVGHGGTPLRGAEDAVAGADEVEGDEDGEGRGRHGPEEDVEVFLAHGLDFERAKIRKSWRISAPPGQKKGMRAEGLHPVESVPLGACGVSRRCLGRCRRRRCRRCRCRPGWATVPSAYSPGRLWWWGR